MKRFNFKGFKKVHSDKSHTTLRNEHGHELKIAHEKLSPKHRGELHALPMMAEGGTPGGSGSPAVDPKKAKEIQDSSQSSGYNPDQWKKNLKEGLGLAKGGPINRYAKGSDDVEGPMDIEPRDEGQEVPKRSKENDDSTPGVYAESPKMYAEGTEDVQPDDNAPPSQAPVTINIHGNQPNQFQQVPPGLQKEAPIVPQGKEIDYTKAEAFMMDEQRAEIAQRAAQTPQMPAQPSENPLTQPTIAPPPETSDQDMAQQLAIPDAEAMLRNSYRMGEQGIAKQSEAEQAQASMQEQALKQNLDMKRSVLENYNNESNNIRAELENVRHDYEKGHINPDAYWDNHSKLLTGIGLILAGFDPAGRPNAALDYVNRRIEDSINTQKANIDKKGNLMSALMHQFNNEGQATQMARLILADQAQAEMQMAAAKSGSKMAQAKALQLKSQMMAQYAPTFQNLALRQTMIKMGQEQGNQGEASMIPYMRAIDPKRAEEMEKRYVPGVGMAKVPVPEAVRKDLIDKTNLLDNVKKLRTFAKQNTGSLDPAKIAEGQALATVVLNQYRTATHQGVIKPSELEFDAKIIDSDPTKFLNKYRSDPRYKTLEAQASQELDGLKQQHGLPVTKADPAKSLNSQQQSFYKWAKSNPGDPRAKMVLKQLGMEE